MSTAVKHVVSRHDRWAVVSAGASRASRVFDEKKEAVKFAREFAKKESGELYVHRKDGTIETRRNFGADSVAARHKE